MATESEKRKAQEPETIEVTGKGTVVDPNRPGGIVNWIMTPLSQQKYYSSENEWLDERTAEGAMDGKGTLLPRLPNNEDRILAQDYWDSKMLVHELDDIIKAKKDGNAAWQELHPDESLSDVSHLEAILSQLPTDEELDIQPSPEEATREIETTPKIQPLREGVEDDPEQHTNGEDTEKQKSSETGKLPNAPPANTYTFGVALSGGGIRSAIFSLGVMQRLNDKDKSQGRIFGHADYLSTVSGGGYMGTSIAWWLSGRPFQQADTDQGRDVEKSQKDVSGFSDADFFPYGSQDPRNNNDQPNSILAYLRRSGKYLVPGNGITLVSGVAILLRAILLNLIVWVPIVTAIFLTAILISNWPLDMKGWVGSQIGFSIDWLRTGLGASREFGLVFLLSIYLAGAIAFVYFFSSLGYSLQAWRDKKEENKGSAEYQNDERGVLNRFLSYFGEGGQKSFISLMAIASAVVIYAVLLIYVFIFYQISAPENAPSPLPTPSLASDFLTNYLGFFAGFGTLGDSLKIQIIVGLMLILVVTASFIRNLKALIVGVLIVLVFSAVNAADDIVYLFLVTGLFAVATMYVAARVAKSLQEPNISAAYSGRRGYEQHFGWLLKVAFALFCFGIIPWAYCQIGEKWYAESGGLSMLGGIASGLWGFLNSGGKSNGGRFTSIILALGSCLFVFGLLLLGYGIADSLLPPHKEFAVLSQVPTYFWVVLMVAIFSGWITNLNYVSLGRFYRDRLMEAFMPDWKTVNLTEAAPASRADGYKLSELWNIDKGYLPRGPYPIINANAILINSSNRKYRLRRGDNFTLTPYFCGSNATGWARTAEFHNGDFTLATAMAVSGAAANPRSGANGKGATTNTAVSLVMTLLNFRLGFWVNRPRKNIMHWLYKKPSHFFPSAAYALTRSGYRETSSYLELSDGAHFENLAMYELIRRRCGLIIVCDGGQDLSASYADFVTLIQRVGEDFGAEIELVPGRGPEMLVPKETPGQYPSKSEFAEQGHFIARIKYGNRGKVWAKQEYGHIIYMKTTMITELSMTAKGYKGANRDFPDETTGDQFFSEEQFEAYREAGYRIANKMLKDDILQGVFRGSRRPDLNALARNWREAYGEAKAAMKQGSKASSTAQFPWWVNAAP